MKNLVAVVNDEIMMVGNGILTSPFEAEFDNVLEKISDAITAHITNDERFMVALGKKESNEDSFRSAADLFRM